VRLTDVRLLAAALLLVALTGCGDDGSADEGEDPAADLAAALEDRDLLVTSIEVDGVDREPVPGTEIRVTFEDASIGVDAGCNHFGGTIRLDGDVVVVDELVSTAMGCRPPLAAQDEWLGDLLVGRPTVSVDGDRVALTDGSTVLVLTDLDAVRPAAALVETTWVLDIIFGGGQADGAASSAPLGEVASVVFRDDGTYTIQTGCNGGSGSYERALAEGGEIVLELGPPAITRRGCPDGAMSTVDSAVVATFVAGRADIVVEGHRLTITTPTGSLGFTAG
jgi:heat shock protein HslJ